MKEKTEKTCNNCHCKFTPKKNSTGKFCGLPCFYGSRNNQIELTCHICSKTFLRGTYRLKNSKSGLYYCSMTCKYIDQKIGGSPGIQPPHYGTGVQSYSVRAKREYGKKCSDCGLNLASMLEVHHKDGNRNNGDLSNLEVLCKNHHSLRHMKFEDGEWKFSTRYLTSKEDLNKLFELIKVT